MMAGIAIGRGDGSGFAGNYWIPGFMLLFMGVLLMIHINYNRFGLYQKPWLPGLLFQMFVFSAAIVHTGSFLLDQQQHHFSHQHSKRLMVEICSGPQEKATTTRFEALVRTAIGDSGSFPSEGKLLISCLRDSASPVKLSIGDRLVVPSRFSEIEGPANPGEFDYRGYMANNSVWHQAFFKASEVVGVGRTTDNFFYKAVMLRKEVVRKLDKYIKDREAAAVISTLLLGYKADLSRQILNTYSATGVMHVLSVSGMHVAIVAALAGYLLGFWKGRRMNIVQALLIIAFVWLYTLLSGLSAAACRSAVMISFVIVGRLLNRNADMFNCVSAAAFFQLLSRPLWLFDIGFQLSYLAVFGLVIFYPAINGMLKFRSRFLQLVWSYIAFSFAAQLATFPLCLYYFNQFPLYFLASNIFIMLPVTVVMYAGVGFLLLTFLPSFADFPLRCLAWLMESGINLLNEGLRFIEKLPASSLHGYHLHIAFYLLVYLFIAVFFVGVTRKNKRAIWWALILLVFLTSIYSVSGLVIWKRKSVVFYSIRNHIAVAFIRTGTATIITDMNVEDKAVSYSLMPLIRNRNLDLNRIVHADTTLVEPDLKISEGSVRFRSLELEIIDKERSSAGWQGPTVAAEKSWHNVAASRQRQQIMLLHNNPDVDIPAMQKRYNIRYVVIGTKNSKRNIERWLVQADSLGIDCHSLKLAGALELDIEDL